MLGFFQVLSSSAVPALRNEPLPLIIQVNDLPLLPYVTHLSILSEFFLEDADRARATHVMGH